MSGIKSLVGKRITKKVKFMGEDIVISKLSVANVTEVQALAKRVDKDAKAAIKAAEEAAELGISPDDVDDMAGLEIIRTVIRAAVEGASELTDEDFQEFPMDELSNIANDIMKFSGVGADTGK